MTSTRVNLFLTVCLCAPAAAWAAQAGGWTGKTLLILESEGGRQMVWAYAAAIADAERQSRLVAQKFPRAVDPAQLACVPENVTQQQLGDGVLNFVRDAPARQHESAYALVRAAMRKHWPCVRR